MLRSLVAAAGLLLAAPAVAAPLPGAKPALPVPVDALVVVQVNGVEKSRGRLQKMLEAAAPDVGPDLTKQFDRMLAVPLVGGRDFGALTPDGRAFVALCGPAEADRIIPIVSFVPVKDYASFRDKTITDAQRKSFKKGSNGVDSVVSDDNVPVYLIDLPDRGYVALTLNADTAEAVAGKFDPLTPALMGPAVAEAFFGADVSVFVNLARVNERYGDKIKPFRQLAGAMMQQGGAANPGLDKRQLDTMREMSDGLFQAAEDGTAVAAGLDFRPEGLALRVEAAFPPGSAAAKGLADEGPAPLPGLLKLPAGLSLYMAGKLGPALTAKVAGLNRELQAQDDDEKAAARVGKYLARAADAQAGGSAAGVSIPDLSVVDIAPKDPAAYVAAKTDALRALTAGARFGNVVLKGPPTIKEDAGTVGGFRFTEARVELDFEATVKGIADANLRDTTVASMKRFAKEQMTFWYGTDGTRVVQVAAPDWPAAGKLVGDYLAGKGGVGGMPAFRGVRSQLPAQSSYVMLAEVGAAARGTANLAADLSETVPGLPIGKLPKLPPTATEPAFVGLAVGLRPGGVRADLFVPVGAVPVVRKVVGPLFEKKED